MTDILGAVLLSAFALSFAFGWIAERHQFCTMGAIHDAYTMGDATRLRVWAAAIAVATVGFALLSISGAIRPLDSVYSGTRLYLLSSVLGGLLFGFGMVLASGCSSKSLIRAATGSVKSWVVLLVMACTALMTLRGFLAPLRVNWIEATALELPVGVHLWQWVQGLGMESQALAQMLLTTIFIAGLLLWVFRAPGGVQWSWLWPGLALGAVVGGMWAVSGVLGHLPEHPETLEAVYLGSHSGRMEALSLTAPLAMGLDALLYFSDGTKRWTLGLASILGMATGAAFSGWQSGHSRWQGFASVRDAIEHLVGGAFMGFGGVLAFGCTIGQGMSGISTLSINSALSLLFIGLGAVLGLRYQARQLLRSDV